jgi:hypothetical protein
VSVDAVYFIVCNPAAGITEDCGLYNPATTIIESLLWTPTLWPMFTEEAGIMLTVTQPGIMYASTTVAPVAGVSDPPR